MRPIAGSGTTEGAAGALVRLRRDLLPALDALDHIAADPQALEELAEELPALQYALHAAAERVPEVDLGPRRDVACDELGTALAVAREETAEVAETLYDGGAAGAGTLVWQWRVALFSVRLALLHLDESDPVEAPQPLPSPSVLPLVLLALGIGGVLGGALAAVWPLWSLGLLLVVACAGLSRRCP